VDERTFRAALAGLDAAFSPERVKRDNESIERALEDFYRVAPTPFGRPRRARDPVPPDLGDVARLDR